MVTSDPLTRALIQVVRLHRRLLLVVFKDGRCGGAIRCFSVWLLTVGVVKVGRCLEVSVGSAELLDDVGQFLVGGRRVESTAERAASVVLLEETCLVFSGQLLLLLRREGRAPPLLLDDHIFVLDLFEDVPQL